MRSILGKMEIDDTNRLLRQILKDNNAKRLDYAELEQTIREIRELAQKEETAQQSIIKLNQEKQAIQDKYSQEKELANEKIQESKLIYNGLAKSLNNMLVEFGWENIQSIQELSKAIKETMQEQDMQIERLETRQGSRVKTENQASNQVRRL